MLLQMEVFHSFSCLTYTPLYTHTHTPHTFHIHSSVSAHLDCFHVLPVLINAASNLPQYSWLENPMDKRTRRATVHGASEDWTRLSKQACRHMEITISFACILGHCASGPAAGCIRSCCYLNVPQGSHVQSGFLLWSEILVVQSLSRVSLFATPWTAARQASLSISNSQSLLKLLSIDLMMPSNHLISAAPFSFHPVFPSIRVFSSESALPIRWPKYWSFSLSLSPSSEYSGLISFGTNWFDLFAVQGTVKSLLQLVLPGAWPPLGWLMRSPCVVSAPEQRF